jgi:hypothetical protein
LPVQVIKIIEFGRNIGQAGLVGVSQVNFVGLTEPISGGAGPVAAIAGAEANKGNGRGHNQLHFSRLFLKASLYSLIRTYDKCFKRYSSKNR